MTFPLESILSSCQEKVQNALDRRLCVAGERLLVEWPADRKMSQEDNESVVELDGNYVYAELGPNKSIVSAQSTSQSEKKGKRNVSFDEVTTIRWIARHSNKDLVYYSSYERQQFVQNAT